MIQTRRKFLRGVGALLAAPAIVRASSLMAVSPVPQYEYVSYGLSFAIEGDISSANRVIIESLRQLKEAITADVFWYANVTAELAAGSRALA